MRSTNFLAAALALSGVAAVKPGPLKVFLLAGQSNVR